MLSPEPPAWKKITAVVTVGSSGAVSGMQFVPVPGTELTSPASPVVRLAALEKTVQASNDGTLRRAIVNVAQYYLQLAQNRSPAEMEALIWQHVSTDGVDHGESCAAFASLTLALGAQVSGQQSWVTGGTTYPWPLHKWGDVRVEENSSSPGITSIQQDAQAHGRWEPVGNGYIPKPGDWVLFNGHVEVVTAWDGNTLSTIGGDSLPNFTVNAHQFTGLAANGVVGFVNNGNLTPSAPAPKPAPAPAPKPAAPKPAPPPQADAAVPGISGMPAPVPAATTAATGTSAIPGLPAPAPAPKPPAPHHLLRPHPHAKAPSPAPALPVDPYTPGVPWSIFSQHNGQQQAVEFAAALLKAVGAPVTKGTVQVIYDWQQSEGSGGANNPLNGGDFNGMAVSGTQYGGGANNYPSLAVNVQAMAGILLNDTQYGYGAVVSALRANNPGAAVTAIWNSSWAGSHYGYGSDWSSLPLPVPVPVTPAPHPKPVQPRSHYPKTRTHPSVWNQSPKPQQPDIPGLGGIND